MQAARRVLSNGQGRVRIDRTRIQAAGNPHDGNPALRVRTPVFHDGPLNGRRPAITRQKGGMHVERRQTRRGQHGVRQNQAIGGHNQHIRLQSGQLSLSRDIFQTSRLQDRKIQLLGHSLDR